MFFSNEQIGQLQDEFDTIAEKQLALTDRYLARHYFANPRAKEYAWHGFVRRVNILARCVENIFSILPPDQVGLPEKSERSDVTINVQAFVFNVFGCTDNLAWIWVLEKDLRELDGSPIRRGWVGLRKNNTLVRESFSLELQSYLRELDRWFEQLEKLRHALAHRIPLYVPPYTIPKGSELPYLELQERIAEAANRADWMEYERLENEQSEFFVFYPIAAGSITEPAPTGRFHELVLADFNTVEQLGHKVLDELSR